MSLTPEFFEPDSEFDTWREYRDKRRRRTLYFLALLLALIFIAFALPSSYSGVLGDTSSQGYGVAGADGSDGKDGKDGADGSDGAQGLPGAKGAQGLPGEQGLPGLQGEPGLPGLPGEPGSPGEPGPSGQPGTPGKPGAPGEPGGSGIGSGQGIIRVGTCDEAISISLRSRIVAGEFFFRNMTVSDISDVCFGLEMDVYILDEDGNEIFSSLGNLIEGASLVLAHDLFSSEPIAASAIEQIAVEIAD